MSKIKAILWDADGVLNLPEEFFSVIYAKSRGMDPAIIEPFFKSEEFKAATAGQADLKELLAKDLSLWQWQGSVDELLNLWFTSEDIRNEPLIKYVQELKQKGMPCYVGTNQEKYRGEYMKAMFKGDFDNVFVSADLGVAKPDPKFFEQILAAIKLPAENLLYFDDTQSHVDAAKKLGIQAHLYQSLDHIKQVLGN